MLGLRTVINDGDAQNHYRGCIALQAPRLGAVANVSKCAQVYYGS